MGLLSSTGRCILIILNIIILQEWDCHFKLGYVQLAINCVDVLDLFARLAITKDLYVINHFKLVALGLIAIGAILKFFPRSIFEFLLNVVTQVLTYDLPFDTSEQIEFVPIIDDVGVTLMVIGCVLVVLSFFACCGACYKWRPFLIVFVICMCMIIIAQSVVGGLFLTEHSTLHSTIKNKLKKQIQTEYRGSRGNNTFSLLLNIFMYELECCGFENKTDFEDTDVWKETLQNKVVINAKVPAACCNRTYYSPYYRNTLKTCIESGDSSVINNQGCYNKLYGYVGDNRIAAILILSAIIIIQVLLVIFSVSLTRDISKHKTGPI